MLAQKKDIIGNGSKCRQIKVTDKKLILKANGKTSNVTGDLLDKVTKIFLKNTLKML